MAVQQFINGVFTTDDGETEYFLYDTFFDDTEAAPPVGGVVTVNNLFINQSVHRASTF